MPRLQSCPLGKFLLTTVVALCHAAHGAEKSVLPGAKAKPAPQMLERVQWLDDESHSFSVAGQVLVEAQDGGLLLIGQDGRLWPVEKPQLVSREAAQEPFRAYSSTVLGKQLQTELGVGFDLVVTKHYVVCTRAHRAYAQWCGSLFERLYLSFHNHWKQRGMKLSEPEFPLVAVVFPNQNEFAAFATKDAGADAATAKGYYSISTNRMVLYDLTSSDGDAAGNEADINRRLAAVPYNIATVVHEATHQIAFNSGMHTRLADNPLWLVEGMAMYFETPDLSSKTGWKTAGAVNDERLGQFRDFLAGRRKPDSLATLIASDARFNDAGQMPDAYGEAWALTQFLIRTRKEAYVGYLNTLAAKPRLVFDTPAERLAEFRAAFGDDLKQLDAEMLKQVKRLK
jgi:hypothetical protein